MHGFTSPAHVATALKPPTTFPAILYRLAFEYEYGLFFFRLEPGMPVPWNAP